LVITETFLFISEVMVVIASDDFEEVTSMTIGKASSALPVLSITKHG